MNKTDDSHTDSKNIEGKALRYFEEYLEDSTIISPYLASDDKEPCWDGHLYLYSEKTIDKNHFSGRIPVQVKGKVMNDFKLNGYKFPIDTNDLRAFLHEPTVFVVCQEKKGCKEKALFYRCLLPETIKKILREKDKQKSISVLMHQFPKQLNDFENKMMVFLGDSRKQLSFADNKSFTMKDVEERGIKQFSFLAPSRGMNEIEILKYLSESPTYYYAKIDKQLDIEIPISEGPMLIAYKQNVNKNISIGETVFFNNYDNEIKDGMMYITIGNILTIIIPINNCSECKTEIKIKVQFLLLKDSIKKAEFLIALYNTGQINIGDFVLNFKVKDKDFIDKLSSRLIGWKAFQNVLDKMHVTKDLEINGVTPKQENYINAMLETIGEGKTIKLNNQRNTLIIIEISNIKLLLWQVVDRNDMCQFGDFFDHSFTLFCQTNENEQIEICPYSYLKSDDLWKKIDNIPYDDLVASYDKIPNKNKHIYEIATFDLLSILHAFDEVKTKDKLKSERLIKSATELNDWLKRNDPLEANKIIHTINHYQIIKRQRKLTDGEKQSLSLYLKDDSISCPNKVAICLLLDKEKMKWQNKCTKKEIKIMKSYPIWIFNNNSKQ